METILIIITIVMSIIIGILTTLKLRYKKNLKSEINLNNYLIKESMCNVDIFNKSKKELNVEEGKYIFVDPMNSYCVVINDEGEYILVEKNKLKSMATAKEIKE